MNKTIIININGIVFHIEEDAYELLKAYMTEVKHHFAYSPDSDEIVGDIENRIAEMFSESLAEEKKQVIVLKDVENVTAQMGAVNEFADAEESEYTAHPYSEKKLFRDTDDRIIGGVCAGIGHYFDVEARTARIIAILICFIAGSGFLVYLILWIVMPPAKTRIEKMAMKGEPLNLQNFKRNFDDEADALKHNFKKAPKQASPGGAGEFFRNLFGLVSTFGNLFRILIKIVGGLIIVAGCMALLAAIIALLCVLGFWNTSQLDFFPFSIITPEYRVPLYFSAFVLVTIPIIALVLFSIRVLFNRKVVTRTGSYVMLVLWLTGVAVGAYYGASLGAQFSEEASYEETISLPALPVYRLELNEALHLNKEDSLEYELDSSRTTRRIMISSHSRESNMPRNMSLVIEHSNVAQPTLVEEFSARGSSFKNALKSAQHITYNFIQQDSVLKFDWAVQIPKKEAWRNQSVRLKLLLPVNTRLYIDGKLNPYLEDYDLRDCQPDNMPDEALSEWLLTDTGLKCKNDSLYKSRQED